MMNYRGRASMIPVVIIILMLLVMVIGYRSLGKDSRDYVKYRVESGQNLWTIVRDNYDRRRVDPRKIIYQIKKINNLNNSIISPGQQLKLPISGLKDKEGFIN